jgi:hypothetical protein
MCEVLCCSGSTGKWNVWNILTFSHNRNKMDYGYVYFSVISHTKLDHSFSTNVEETTKIPP